MALSKVDAIIHPVRLRILQTIQGRQLTPQQIRDLMPDVPQATLYRHINKLTEAGVLTVAEERPVHGTLERVYALVQEAANLRAADLAETTPEDHLRYFRVFVGTLLNGFERYIRHEDADFVTDRVSYYMMTLNLTDAEYDTLRMQLRALIEDALSNPPGPGRRRRTIGAVAVPDPSDM